MNDGFHQLECWEHYCEVEKTDMGVGKNEPCNWCGLTEETYNSLRSDTRIVLNEEHEGIKDHPRMPHFKEG
tara:strand:+ start:945 stop:1157 length:213 start_codon:yes stop_codon:yes gene_type:complete